MKTRVMKLSAVCLTIALAIGMLSGCGQKTIDGTKTAATVNGETITVGDVSFEANYQAAMFNSYYGAYFSEYYDQVYDEETGATYGDQTVDYALEAVEEAVLIAQHAEEYGVSLDGEETAAIDAASQAYIDKNAPEIRDMIGADKDTIARSLTRQTIRSKMLDVIAEDVDTNVDDEEVKMAGYMNVYTSLATEESIPDEEERKAANEEKLENMKAILAEAKEAGPDADLSAIVAEYGEEYSAYEGSFRVNDPAESGLDEATIEALGGLSEGEYCDDVFTTSTEDMYVFVRYDTAFDEDATASEKETEIRNRKQEHFDELLEGWKADAKIETFDEELRKIVITDKRKFTFSQTENAESADSADSAESAE